MHVIQAVLVIMDMDVMRLAVVIAIVDVIQAVDVMAGSAPVAAVMDVCIFSNNMYLDLI